MASSFGLKPVMGAGGIGTDRPGTSEESLAELYKTLLAHGCTTLDTAKLYGDSETWLGKTHAADRFTIDSKTLGGFVPGASSKTGIPQHAKDAVALTGAKQLDVYYIHAPDASIPLEEMLQGIQTAYESGAFRRFGLSNYTPDQVQEVYDLSRSKGWVLPTVYQGNYNAVARRQETDLFPLLRKLGISFYAYSPIAGGFLTKTRAKLTEGKSGSDGAGRFAAGHPIASMYNSLYADKESYLQALDLWGEAAQLAGCSQGELAYRWVAFDSPLSKDKGDAIIFGASSIKQADETLTWLKKGSVGAPARAKIDEIWKVVEKDAPRDNYNDFTKRKA